MLHPTAIHREHRRAREMPGAEQPRDGKGPRFPAPFKAKLFAIKAIDRPAALAQGLAGEAFPVIGLQRQSVARLALQGDAVSMAGSAAERYCSSENKSCCAESCLADMRLTAANSRSASGLRPSAR